MTKGGGFQHIAQLDGVRALAILLVYVAHCGFEHIVPGGLGVTIFFFLSGYLITSLMRSEAAQTGRLDLRAFYLRRALRILPPLYITLAFSALGTLLWLPRLEILPAGVLSQAFFYANYWPGSGVPTVPMWSLAVEEHYYLLFPLLFVAFLGRKTPRQAAMWCAAACGIALLIRIVSVFLIPDPERLYYWTHSRFDSILFGACLAFWHNPALDDGAWRPKTVHVLAAIAALLLCLAIRNEVFRHTIRYSIQGVALFVLFSWVLQAKGIVFDILTSWPMRLVGLYSYTLYLVHLLFIELVLQYLPALPRLLIFPVSAVGATAYAALMYRFVEQPAARLRRALHKTDAEATPISA